jgi:hypothetical protein
LWRDVISAAPATIFKNALTIDEILTHGGVT